jgi:hypothetical protein
MREGKTKAILIGLGLLATWLIPFPKGKKGTTKYTVPISPEPPPVMKYKTLGFNWVEMKTTPLTRGQANYAIKEAFREVEGRNPTNSELRILSAHSALETANWAEQGRGFHNYNFGNFRGKPFFKQRVPEFIDGKKVMVDQEFKSYTVASSGARGWLMILKKNWPAAWKLLDSDNIAAYTSALKNKGRIGVYFTADEDHYAKALQARYV